MELKEYVKQIKAVDKETVKRKIGDILSSVLTKTRGHKWNKKIKNIDDNK